MGRIADRVRERVGPPRHLEVSRSLARVDSAAQPIGTDHLPWPVWQFRAYAAATGRFVLHGTGSEPILEFEPR